MADMDDKLFGVWGTPNPSPRTLMSNFLNEEFGSKSFTDILVENGSERLKMPINSKEELGDDGTDFSSNVCLEPSFFNGQKSSSRGGLAQRIARAGFNAPTINTSRVITGNIDSASSEVCSPYLTIPPGLSPTTLLESPVFLSNSMVQPSPTTGKFSFMSNGTNSFSITAIDSAVPDKSKDDQPEDLAPGGFSFKPHLNTSSSSYFSSLENKGSSAIDPPQSLQSTEVSFRKDFKFPASFSESSDQKHITNDNTICPMPTDSLITNEQSPPLEDQPGGEGNNTKEEISFSSVSAPADDGYNWRKYGQKQVKGSEYPRSYYKCTHPNCPVKKKIERSPEGHITEIIYKGVHNHEKPLPNRRSGILPSNLFNDVQIDGQANFDGTTRDVSCFGSPEAIDVSSSVSNDDEEEEGATHGSASVVGGDGDGDENESKRRKLDACAVEVNTGGSRQVREPRVVVQTTSEVDILDDGYRWRKYGQKVVKGNPNPRSYYKCTSPGCTVRKHVERASHDLKSVITTYEGKHNHDVPVARNSSSTHSNTSGPTTTTQPQRAVQTQNNGFMHLDGPPLLTNFGPCFSFRMGPPGLAGLGLGGLGPQVNLGLIHANFMGQQNVSVNSGAGFVMPKGEQEEEPVVSESGLLDSNRMDAYHQLMSRLPPLGPQM